MVSFADNVFRAFEDLFSKHRFVPVKAGASSRFAALVRREDEKVFIYVFVSDGRPRGANLDVDVWVAPPDEPGDGLDSLYVGYKIRIGSEYEVDDVYFVKCQDRIIRFLDCVTAIVPLVRQELKEPSFRTRRWTVYQLQVHALETLVSAARDGDVAANAALVAAEQLATGKGSLAKLKDVMMPIAILLLEKKALNEDALQFFNGKAKSLASALASHLYMRALGEVSHSKGK